MRKHLILSLLLCGYSVSLFAAPDGGFLQNLFGADGMIPLITVIKKEDGNNTTYHVYPRNVALMLGAGFVLYKMSGKLADFLYPYVLHMLPSVGPIARWQKEYILKQQEADFNHEERKKKLEDLIKGKRL